MIRGCREQVPRGSPLPPSRKMHDTRMDICDVRLAAAASLENKSVARGTATATARGPRQHRRNATRPFARVGVRVALAAVALSRGARAQTEHVAKLTELQLADYYQACASSDTVRAAPPRVRERARARARCAR